MPYLGDERSLRPGLILPRLSTLLIASSALLLSGIAFPALVRDNALPAAFAGLYVLAACGAGRVVERRWGLLHLENRFLVGLFLLSAWNQGLALLGALGGPALIVPLFAFPALLLLKAPERNETEPVPAVEERRVLPESLAVCIAFAALVLSAFFAGAPPVFADTLLYHLGLPRQYLLHGGLAADLPRDLVLQFQQSEMALLPLVSLDPGGRAASLLGVPLFAALAANTGRVAALEGGKRSDWLAAAAVLTSPVLLAFCAYTKNDLMALAAALGAIAVVQEARKFERPAAGRFVAAGFLAGAALAVKPSMALILAPWLLTVPWMLRARLFTAAKFVLAAAFLPASWVIRNVAVFGSPWSDNYTMQSTATIAAGGATLPTRLAHLFDSFHTVGALLDGPLGPLLLALVLLAALAIRERPGLRPLLLASAGGFFLWAFIGGDHPRFLLPVILPLTACGASTRLARSSIVSVLLLAVALVSLVVGSVLLERTTGYLALQSGRVTSRDFLARNLDSLGLQEIVSTRLPERAVIMMVGEPRVFHLGRRARFDLTWRPETVMTLAHEHHDPAILALALKRSGVTHVLYNPALLRQSFESGAKPAPPCPRDLATFMALLSDPELCVLLRADPTGTGGGLFALR